MGKKKQILKKGTAPTLHKNFLGRRSSFLKALVQKDRVASGSQPDDSSSHNDRRDDDQIPNKSYVCAVWWRTPDQDNDFDRERET